ncbi:MFS transporter [Microbacterium azadirachtae]|uniref:Major Facilitator Superfamily protein n=1 Tax=Microbacterium azadirachtae TaxID=582680 RepID=A0A0F0LJS1_9MICO|nr:MFS transporter [Microbacterium azadirachtae]KJL32560.1 Major Facilitator Superfamily protein [Microbacterium azadirachtae]
MSAQDQGDAVRIAKPAGPPWREPGMPALLAMTTFAFAGFAVMLPVAPMHMVALGGDELLAGLVNAVLMAATILTQLVVERMRSWMGWRVSLALACLLLGLPALGEIFATTPGQVLALAAVRGIGFGIVTVSGSSAVGALFPPERRGRAIGAYGLAVAGAQLVLTPISPWIADQAGLPVALAVAALPLLGIPFALAAGASIAKHARAAAAAAIANGAAAAPVAHESPREARHALTRLWPPILALTAVTCAGGAITTFTPQFVPDAVLTVVALFLYTAAAAFARWAVGGPADRVGAERFVLPGLAIAALGLGAIATGISGLVGSASPILLIGGAILVGTAFGTMQNVTLVRAFEVAGEHAKGVASTAWNVAFDAGTGIGALAIGALAAGTSFTLSFVALTLLCLVVAAVLAVVRRATRPA